VKDIDFSAQEESEEETLKLSKSPDKSIVDAVAEPHSKVSVGEDGVAELMV
jgi:hypothetical protein